MRASRLISFWVGCASLVALSACGDGESGETVAGSGGAAAAPAVGGTGGAVPLTGGTGPVSGGSGGDMPTVGGSGGSVPVTGGSGPGVGGSGGTAPVTGGAAGSTTGGTSGTPGTGGSAGFGTPQQSGSGTTSDRWMKSSVYRNGLSYYFMANGWGPNFGSQTVSWEGTSFTVVNMTGSEGSNWQPASYPTVFCGEYSDSRSGQCGLPRAISEITNLYTGWRWAPGNGGQYNAAYDIWLGNGATVSSHSGFLMVWLHDPSGQQPAGRAVQNNITVSGVPGTWNIWNGPVGELGNQKPCISYVRPEGQDSLELEFDVMDFVRDLPSRSIQLPGSHILSVAVGFEIWNGPVSNLVSDDFYVDVR